MAKTGQVAKRFSTEIVKKIRLRYQLFLPSKYDADRQKRWPLMLFLHGAGERGSDVEAVTTHGPPKLVKRRKAFPFIVASPQCQKDARWHADALVALLDDLVDRYRVDEDRIYVTGLSMGGAGCWAMGGTIPGRLAAIVPICGGGSRVHARQIATARLPVWAFHGGRDRVIVPQESERMVDYVNSFGGDAKLTIYPKAKHDSWTETYSNQDVYDWMLSHRLSEREYRVGEDGLG